MTRTRCCSRECKGVERRGGLFACLTAASACVWCGAPGFSCSRASCFLAARLVSCCARVSVLGVPRYLRGNASFVDRKEESV